MVGALPLQILGECEISVAGIGEVAGERGSHAYCDEGHECQVKPLEDIHSGDGGDTGGWCELEFVSLVTLRISRYE